MCGLIFVGYLTLLLATMQMGHTRDEGFYFNAAHTYYGWFDELEENIETGYPEESFEQSNIDQHWSNNPEHPVLMKALFGLSWDAFSQERDWMSPVTAMRFPTAVFSALLLGLVFLFTIEAFGSRLAGLFAVFAIGFQPRFFFHAHLACFDAAVTFVWFLVVYAYWRSMGSRLWAWLTGFFFGLALLTKLNAFFIPIALLLHWFLTGFWKIRFKGGGFFPRLQLPKIPLAFVSMAIVGPLVFYVAWPRLWFDTFNRIIEYIGRHWSHEHYFVQYFGEGLIRPPFPASFPWVMLLITVPIVVILAGALGWFSVIGEWSRRKWEDRDDRGTGTLLAINFLLPILIISRPETPIFGGTKHWMPAMPFLAMFAGIGVIRAFNWLWPKAVPPTNEGKSGPKDGSLGLIRGATLALFLMVLTVPLVHATLYVHPYGTSYYNEVIGGVRGAADEGMMRQYWGYSTRASFDFLNEHAPNRARVFPHNANGDAMYWYRADGLLREDIRDAWSIGGADYILYNHQRAFISNRGNPPGALMEVWDAAGTVAPIRVWTVNGVPILSLYGDAQSQQRYFDDLITIANE